MTHVRCGVDGCKQKNFYCERRPGELVFCCRAGHAVVRIPQPAPHMPGEVSSPAEDAHTNA